MRMALSSEKDNFVNVIVQIPHLSEMKKRVFEQSFTEQDFLDWIGFIYEEMLTIPYEKNISFNHQKNYIIGKLLEDYKSYLFQEIQEYISKIPINSFYKFSFIPFDSLLILIKKEI